jgi:putative transposase
VQGSQYTSEIFTKTVLDNGIELSMNDKERANDNTHVERLWRTVKYESIYLNPPVDDLDLRTQLDELFRYYNQQRRQSGINHKKLIDIYANCPSFPNSNSFNKTVQKMRIRA